MSRPTDERPWWRDEPPADLHPDYDPDPVDPADEFSEEDRDYFADLAADRYEREIDARFP